MTEERLLFLLYGNQKALGFTQSEELILKKCQSIITDLENDVFDKNEYIKLIEDKYDKLLMSVEPKLGYPDYDFKVNKILN